MKHQLLQTISWKRIRGGDLIVLSVQRALLRVGRETSVPTRFQLEEEAGKKILLVPAVMMLYSLP